MQSLIYIKSALRALHTQRMRTFLTTLGIIIGVMTVIAMMSIIEGMNRYVYKVLGNIGSNTIYVQKYQWQMGPGGHKSRKEWREIAKRKDLTKEDAEAIEELPSVDLATLTQSTRGAQVTYRDNKIDIQEIEGGTIKYLKILNYAVVKGRGFVESDIAFRRQVAIVGPYVVDNLFKKGEDPLGKNVSMGSYKFTIVGILEEKGSFMGQNVDNKAIVPLTTLKKFVRRRSRYRVWGAPSIVAQVHPDYTVNESQQDIEELLRARRGCKFNEENDFALNTQQMILDAYNKITRGIFIAMIGIASLSLLVGGIGIMNIMLISVIERTKEIGIRMAVGAKRKDIMFQFLTEAIVLTVTGGIIGILLGFGLSKLISILTPLPASTPFWSILVGIGFSASVGVFFGIYPARKASKLNPIEALRRE